MDADLLEELDSTASTPLRCVEKFVAQFGEDNRETIVTAMNHHGPANKVSVVLRRRGIIISQKAILAHRREACGCYE